MSLVPYESRTPHAGRYPIVGYVLTDGRYVCEACIDDIAHDVDQAQPVRTCDPDQADIVCYECGESRQTAWCPEDPEGGWGSVGIAA